MRVVKINIVPQMDDPNTFTILISVRSEDETHDEMIQTYEDISGLSGVFAQLSMWSEQFTATGGAHLWTFVSSVSPAPLLFDFS